MKFYRFSIMITFLFWGLQVNAFWSKWFDTIAAKINNITDVILHKEFHKAKKLELHNETGSIVINSWKQDSIAIEVITSCTESTHREIKLDMECLDEIIKIHTIFKDEKIKATVLFNILLPKNSDIVIQTKQGDIIVKDVSGNLFLETLQGNIKLVNPNNMLTAKTDDGNILIRTDSIENSKEFNLNVDKGNIEIYTTSAINTYMNACAPQGKIISELPITLDSYTTTLNADAWKKFKQFVHGSIGNPLSKLNINAHNGSISIMPYIKQNDIF